MAIRLLTAVIGVFIVLTTGWNVLGWSRWDKSRDFRVGEKRTPRSSHDD
jgi:hypothetical protein